MSVSEEREKALKNFKPLLRSVVQSNPRGVAISDLSREYRLITYDELPVRKFGCRNVEDLLRLCSDTVMFVDGMVRAVVDKDTAHLQELLNRQKKPKKKKKASGFAPPRPFRSSAGRSGGGFSGPRGPNVFNPGPPARRPPAVGFASTRGPPMAGRQMGQPTFPPAPARSNGFNGFASAPSSSSAASASAAVSVGNPVTNSSPDAETFQLQIMYMVKDKPQGLFLKRIAVLYRERYRRDLSEDLALQRIRSSDCFEVQNSAANMPIVYVKKTSDVQSPSASPSGQSVGASPQSAQSAPKPQPAASTRQASTTTAGLAITVQQQQQQQQKQPPIQQAQRQPPPSKSPVHEDGEYDELIENPHAENNYKNKLTTFVVKKFGAAQRYMPVYDYWQDDNDTTFTASVAVDKHTFYGCGKSAKKAQFIAAKNALLYFRSQAPRAAQVPRALPASAVSDVAEEFSRAVRLSETEKIAAGAAEPEPEPEPEVPVKGQVVRMKPLPPTNSPHPTSFSVFKDVRQKKGYLDVHITSVQGPYCIYATLFENRGICQELDKALSQYSVDRAALTPLRLKKENSVCLVRNEDSRPFRAVIEYLDMDCNEVVVRYLDHGDVDRIPFDELYELPEDVYWPEYQAFRLVLHNLTADGDDFEKLNDELEDLILEKDMVADVLYQMDLNDERLWVDLWDTSGTADVNINEMLRDRYKTTQEFNLDLPPPGDSLLVRVTQLVVGARDLSLFVQRAQNSSHINKMVQSMTRHFEESDTTSRAQSLLSEDEFLVNKKCCVRWRDDMWYRAVIKNVMPDKKSCEVSFLDYGYTTVVRRIDLRRMYTDKQDSGDVIHLPAQCKECHLAGISSQFELTRAIENYCSAITDQPLRLTVVEKGAEGRPDKVRVFFSEQGQDIDLSERLMDIHEGRFTEKQMTSYIVACSGEDQPMPRSPALALSVPVQHVTTQLPLPAATDPPSKEFTPVYVLHAAAPDYFACALATEEMVAQYNTLLEVMEAAAASLRAPLKKQYRWSQGDVCAAPVEGYFMRVRIMLLNGTSAEVFLLDDGKQVTVPVNSLRELPEAAWSCPFQVFFAQLFGIAPAKGSAWLPEACKRFVALTADTALQARFMGKSEAAPSTPTGRLQRRGTHIVALADVTGERDVFIHRQLVAEGLALSTQ